MARSSRTPPRRAARMPGTPSSPRARPSPAGRARPHTTAARCCTASPSCWRVVARSSSTRSSPSRASSRRGAGRQVDAAIDTWVWYAGWADKYAAGRRQRERRSAGPYFNISVPEPTGVVAIVAPQDDSPSRPGQRHRARTRLRQHGRRRRQRERTAVARSASPRCSRRATFPGEWSTSSPDRPRRSRRGSPATRTSMRSTSPGRPSLDWVDLQISAADTLKRVLPPVGGADPDRRASTGSSRSPKPRPSGIRRA